MAWNEPGGGKDRDPWGNGGDQGPPDLDEAFRKLQNSLSQMFGGKGNNGGGSGGTGGTRKSLSFNVIALGVLLMVLIYLGLGVYQVDEQEKGVVLRFGKLTPGVIMPGLHWNAPMIDSVLIENVTRVRSRPHLSLIHISEPTRPY